MGGVVVVGWRLVFGLFFLVLVWFGGLLFCWWCGRW